MGRGVVFPPKTDEWEREQPRQRRGGSSKRSNIQAPEDQPGTETGKLVVA